MTILNKRWTCTKNAHHRVHEKSANGLILYWFNTPTFPPSIVGTIMNQWPHEQPPSCKTQKQFEAYVLNKIHSLRRRGLLKVLKGTK
jgi:hypothetical protein